MKKIELQIHVNYRNSLLLNPERIKLLRQIAKSGSLLKASEKLGISYNKAWNMLESLNLVSEDSVLEKIRGGKGGGGAALTKYGNQILEEYNAIEKVVNQFNEQLNKKLTD